MARRSATAAEIAKRTETLRLKKNAALGAWREKDRDRYNAYIREWRAKKRAEVGSDKVATAARKTTTVDIDQGKLASVRRVLGTRTLRETVDRSFDEVLARAAREEVIAQLRTMDGLDLDRPEVMAKAWR